MQNGDWLRFRDLKLASNFRCSAAFVPLIFNHSSTFAESGTGSLPNVVSRFMTVIARSQSHFSCNSVVQQKQGFFCLDPNSVSRSGTE